MLRASRSIRFLIAGLLTLGVLLPTLYAAASEAPGTRPPVTTDDVDMASE